MSGDELARIVAKGRALLNAASVPENEMPRGDCSIWRIESLKTYLARHADTLLSALERAESTAARLAQLDKLLEHRDKFIVDHGLFSEYVALCYQEDAARASRAGTGETT